MVATTASYADTVQGHMRALDGAVDQFDREEINRVFHERMKDDLRTLRSELCGNKTELVLRPVVLAGFVAAGTAASGVDNLTTVLATGAAAVLGSDWKAVGSAVADMFSSGLAFNRQQRDMLAKHPMAYMYELSLTR